VSDIEKRMPHDELIERLLATRSIQHTVSARDDDDPVPRVPINPDGPEAAEALTTMQAREATLIRDARSAGFDAAVLRIEQWAPGFYSDDTRRKLEAIVCDLRRVKDEALGTSGLVER
jgi:hypothetical protein